MLNTTIPILSAVVINILVFIGNRCPIKHASVRNSEVSNGDEQVYSDVGELPENAPYVKVHMNALLQR